LKDDVYRESIEIGYFIGEPFWGKGIATKAVGKMLGHIEKNFAVSRIYAEVFEHNKASMNVLRKNGFYLEGIRKKAVIKDGVVMDDYVWAKLIIKK
jgi:[ribosomal protein S5]-alanine N-acetyltransferase